MTKQSSFILDRAMVAEIRVWQPEVVECMLGVKGDLLHIDHAYELFSALSRKQTVLHDPSLKIGIFGINGSLDRKNKTILHLSDRSKLRLRLPIQEIGIVYRLEGQSLIVGSYELQLGEVKISLLDPLPTLTSRLIVIKNATDPDLFLASCQRQIDELNIKGEIALDDRSDGQAKYKTIKVRGFTVMGFGLTVTNLNPIDSLILQQEGLGGKRKMGCGMFVPVQRRNNDETQNDDPA
jgi:CRISPR-associated protein Cas6